MAVLTPGFFGLILRKNDRTRRRIAELTDWFLTNFPDATEEQLNQDEHLIAFSVAMNGHDLAAEAKRLESSGCTRGVDFVATCSGIGVLDAPMPAWLAMELAPTGNPPELAAKMEPDVRARWERNRTKLYVLVTRG